MNFDRKSQKIRTSKSQISFFKEKFNEFQYFKFSIFGSSNVKLYSFYCKMVISFWDAMDMILKHNIVFLNKKNNKSLFLTNYLWFSGKASLSRNISMANRNPSVIYVIVRVNKREMWRDGINKQDEKLSKYSQFANIQVYVVSRIHYVITQYTHRRYTMKISANLRKQSNSKYENGKSKIINQDVVVQPYGFISIAYF